VTKLANPWKCDNPTCGILRENDANHWLIIRVWVIDPDSRSFEGESQVIISRWNGELAEFEGTKHACGIDCGLKIAAALIEANFFKPSPSPVPQNHPGSAISSTREGGGNE